MRERHYHSYGEPEYARPVHAAPEPYLVKAIRVVRRSPTDAEMDAAVARALSANPASMTEMLTLTEVALPAECAMIYTLKMLAKSEFSARINDIENPEEGSGNDRH